MTDSRVAAPPDAGSDSPGVYGWDWSATTHQGREHVVNDLCDAMGAEFLIPGKGLQGWPHSIEGYDAEGFKVGQVYYGGGRGGGALRSTPGRGGGAGPPGPPVVVAPPASPVLSGCWVVSLPNISGQVGSTSDEVRTRL